MRNMFLLVVACVTLMVFVPAHAQSLPVDLPPIEEPPVWDKSSVIVSAACVEGEPVFTVLNHGAAMTGPSDYWLLNTAGGAADCAVDTAGTLSAGTFQLGADESIEISFVDAGDPPYRICVAQRPGHPGEGYASATAEESPDCVTALDEVLEPGVLHWHVFVPSIRK
jgi:hypothetical protein